MHYTRVNTLTLCGLCKENLHTDKLAEAARVGKPKSCYYEPVW